MFQDSSDHFLSLPFYFILHNNEFLKKKPDLGDFLLSLAILHSEVSLVFSLPVQDNLFLQLSLKLSNLVLIIPDHLTQFSQLLLSVLSALGCGVCDIGICNNLPVVKLLKLGFQLVYLLFQELILHDHILGLHEDIHIGATHQLAMAIGRHALVKLLLRVVLRLREDKANFASILQMKVLRVVSRVINTLVHGVHQIV